MGPIATLDLPPTATSELGPFRRRDYEELPEEPRCELIYGRFYMSPSPALRHQIIALLLWRMLDDFSRSSGGLAVAAPLDVHLGDHSVVQPDVVYVSAQRLGIAQTHLEGAPDLVAEILSPGTARRDRDAKLKLYLESGVREYWIVDPESRQIEFLVAAAGRFQVALALDGAYRSEAIAGLTLEVAALWDEVARRLPEVPSD